MVKGSSFRYDNLGNQSFQADKTKDRKYTRNELNSSHKKTSVPLHSSTNLKDTLY